MATVFQPKSEDLSDVSNVQQATDDDETETIPMPENGSEKRINAIEKLEILDFKDEAFMLTSVLTDAECDHYIKHGHDLGFKGIAGAKKEYRNSSRIMLKSDDLADLIWKRVKPFLDDIIIEDDPHKIHIHGVTSLLKGKWRPLELNNIFRLCHYEPGGHFAPHYDGHLVRSSAIRSMKTLMLYLNGSFEKGTTNFVDESQLLFMDGEGKYCAEEKNVLYRIHPKTGLAVIFNHHRLHEGEAVRNGVKYILRTDIMYERDGSNSIDPKEEKALQIVQEAERLEASGDQMEAMKLYRKAFKMSPSVAESYGN